MAISMKQEVKIWMKNNKIQEVKWYDFMWGRLPMYHKCRNYRTMNEL